MNIYELLRYVLFAAEGVAALAGILCMKRVSGTYWKWFPVYLRTIFLTEIGAEIHYQFIGDYEVNAAIHFFFSLPLQIFFFIWLFGQVLNGRKFLVWTAGVVFFLAWLADIFFFRNTYHIFSSFSYTIGNILLLALMVAYFLELIHSPGVVKYRQSMIFWVCLAMLLFYLGTLPFYGLYNMLSRSYPEIFNTYWIVATLLDIFMYLIFAVALLWKEPN
ncbi:MAG: hypothetical protein KAX45_03700 [Chitinophagaceae bacterium]|nr:hypothetical protein [Chitinophagaceae bacterium]MBP8243622.1 hypothetical protein [Chitinophagaceae bacterium]